MPKKICSGCGHPRKLTDFHWKDRAKGTRQSRCKTCSREAVNKHFRENTERYCQRQRDRRLECRRLYLQYLSLHHCVDCGEDDPVVLVPDHVRGRKTHGISKLLHNNPCWTAVLKELKKCDIRCANCHARKTAREQGWHKLLGRSDSNRELAEPKTADLPIDLRPSSAA